MAVVAVVDLDLQVMPVAVQAVLVVAVLGDHLVPMPHQHMMV